MELIVFFTYGISLRKWEKSGLLDREIKLYRYLNEKFDIQFTFVTYGNEDDLHFESLIDGLKIIPIYMYSKNSNYKFINLINSFLFPFKLKRILPPKKYILKTNQMYGSWVAIVYKLITKLPLILRTGYDLFSFSIKQKKSKLKQFFYYVLTTLALNLSDIYISTSKNDIDFLKKYFIFKKNKIYYIPNWVQTKDVIEINKRSQNVISVGRLEKQKDFEYLINSFISSKIILHIFGEGSEKSSLEKMVGQNSNISLLSTIPNEELITKYGEYQIYVSTSDYEGNSKTILEAMGAGCVVIIPDIKNNIELVTNYKNGILYNKKTDNLQKIIINTLLDSTLKKEISKNSIKQIEENNSLEVVSLLEVNCYQYFLK